MAATTRRGDHDRDEASNIERAPSVLSPCSAIRDVKICPPTTVTPRAMIPTAMSVVRIAERDPRKPSPGQAGPCRGTIEAGLVGRDGPRGSHGREGRRSGRAIAHAPDRDHEARPLGRVAELVAQPSDVDVDRPVEDGVGVAAVDGVEELVAVEDPAVGLEQGGQQPEFERRQRHRRPVDPCLVTVAIEVQAIEAQKRPGLRAALPEPDAGAPGRPVRLRIRSTRRTSSAGEKGLGR